MHILFYGYFASLFKQLVDHRWQLSRRTPFLWGSFCRHRKSCRCNSIKISSSWQRCVEDCPRSRDRRADKNTTKQPKNAACALCYSNRRYAVHTWRINIVSWHYLASAFVYVCVRACAWIVAYSDMYLPNVLFVGLHDSREGTKTKKKKKNETTNEVVRRSAAVSTIWLVRYDPIADHCDCCHRVMMVSRALVIALCYDNDVPTTKRRLHDDGHEIL